VRHVANDRTISRKQCMIIDDIDFQIATNVNKIPEIFSMTIHACYSAETSFQQLLLDCQHVSLSAVQMYGFTPLCERIFTELFAIKINNRGKNTRPFRVPEFPWQIRLDLPPICEIPRSSRALATPVVPRKNRVPGTCPAKFARAFLRLCGKRPRSEFQRRDAHP